VLTDIVPHRDSAVDTLDPRMRVLLALACSLTPLFLMRWDTLLVALAAAAGLLAYERIPSGVVVRRLAVVNGFMATLIVLAPWSVPGETLLTVGPFSYTREGLVQVTQIAVRGNTVVIVLTAMLGTLEPIDFAHALQRLRVPARFVVLFLFTVRYVAVLEKEYRRLRQAMRARAFRPAINGHTLRSFGNLVGMLLVRALDRSERIQQAMICRGFRGEFHTHRHLRMNRMDGMAAAVAFLGITGLMAVEFL